MAWLLIARMHRQDISVIQGQCEKPDEENRNFFTPYPRDTRSDLTQALPVADVFMLFVIIIIEMSKDRFNNTKKKKVISYKVNFLIF